eukprot:TRINITY_DN4491_c0_g2_i1.p1 TRINITY_DN4491_c0_g2~~TRINITY_DN4491_c0_g2_i1.p1  ORF type:complete len:301 (+),score=48.75 TRINITY_DN4491_c0_g2_i1:76-903(+)
MAFCVYVRHGEQTHAVELDPGASVRDLLAAAAASTGLDDVRGRLIHGGTPLSDLDVLLADAGIGAEAAVEFERRSNWRWDPNWGTVHPIEAGKVEVHRSGPRESSTARLLPPIPPGCTERVALRFLDMIPRSTRVGLCEDFDCRSHPDIVGNGSKPSGVGICAAKDISWHFSGDWPRLQKAQKPKGAANFWWDPGDVLVCTVDRVKQTLELQRMRKDQGEFCPPVTVMTNLPTDTPLYFVVCFYDDDSGFPSGRRSQHFPQPGSARIVEIVEDFC